MFNKNLVSLKITFNLIKISIARLRTFCCTNSPKSTNQYIIILYAVCNMHTFVKYVFNTWKLLHKQIF